MVEPAGPPPTTRTSHVIGAESALEVGMEDIGTSWRDGEIGAEYTQDGNLLLGGSFRRRDLKALRFPIIPKG